MKLSKTEIKLINKAKCPWTSIDHKIAVEHYYGHGAEGGKISGGSREFQAGMNLVKKGLFTIKNRDSSQLYKNGWSTTVTSISLEPTDKFFELINIA